MDFDDILRLDQHDSGRSWTSTVGRDLLVASDAICPAESKFLHVTSLAFLA